MYLGYKVGIWQAGCRQPLWNTSEVTDDPGKLQRFSTYKEVSNVVVVRK
jgi:hypothetical protein